MSRSSAPDSGNSGNASGRRPDWLDLDALPIATGAEAEALERNRPEPMTLDQYALFVRSVPVTAEEVRKIPTAEGLSRFELDK